jgi:hypothetical protein
MINRRNLIQFLSAIPLVNIDKLQALEKPFDVKDVVSLSIEKEIQLEPSNYEFMIYELPKTKVIVKIENKYGYIYKFVGDKADYYDNNGNMLPGYNNPYIQYKCYFELLDYEINSTSLIVFCSGGKVVVSK